MELAQENIQKWKGKSQWISFISDFEKPTLKCINSLCQFIWQSCNRHYSLFWATIANPIWHCSFHFSWVTRKLLIKSSTGWIWKTIPTITYAISVFGPQNTSFLQKICFTIEVNAKKDNGNLYHVIQLITPPNKFVF